jgi:hypothetical protein
MKKCVWLVLLFCFACSQKSKTPAIHISLVNNNQSIKLTGLNNAVVSEISRDSVPEMWETLAPVYRMPADTELKNYQPIQHGTYAVKDSFVIFTPDTPLVKGQAYFMRYHQFKGENMWDYIKGKKRLGTAQYVDLSFKD